MNTLNHSIKRVLIAAGLAAAVAAPAWATEPEADVSPDSAAHAQWRAIMAQNSAPSEGCFHASYPNIVWEKLDCQIGKPRVRPTRAKPTNPELQVVGNTNDYVAKATGLINTASGGFATKGVKSETGVGVAAFKDQGILSARMNSRCSSIRTLRRPLKHVRVTAVVPFGNNSFIRLTSSKKAPLGC